MEFNHISVLLNESVAALNGRGLFGFLVVWTRPESRVIALSGSSSKLLGMLW